MNTQLPKQQHHQTPAFTIVELLIVIVVIGILAAISIIAYNGINTKAAEASLQSDLTNASKQLGMIHAEQGGYPSSLPSDAKATKGNTFHYDQLSSGSDYCLTATSSNSSAKAYYISSTTGTVAEATTSNNCPGHPTGGSTGGGGGSVAHGTLIQTITNANCPTDRVRAVDARDNHTYWVQKMPDDKCWMLTNLAYAGGGTNSYGDTKTLTEGTVNSYTTPHYYIPTGANPTSGTTDPSTATNGTGQYGYLYNFCAANGGQTGNGACSSSSDAPVNTSTSICPAGWRLPTGGSGGEFQQLTTNAIGATNAAGATTLQQVWLAQRGGYWYFGPNIQGSSGYYWSSSQGSVTAGFRLYFNSSGVNPAYTRNKVYGLSVRCVAV